MKNDLIAHLSGVIDYDIINFSPVSGGCINQCYKLQSKGQNYFVKLNDTFNPFEEERNGLDILRSTNTFSIPQVFEIGTYNNLSFLLMEYIESKNQLSDFWILFGKKLAKLHSNSNENFGLDHNNYIGSLKQENTFFKNGVDFFINCRLIPQLEQLNNSRDSQLYKSFDKLFLFLPDIIPNEPPSLVHGDLWNGNFLIDKNGEPALVDPAVYYGNREVDIAMGKLFGGFSDEFYQIYNEVFPLENGWEKRIQIWNLYPLLVHANLFGGSYLNQINSILKSFN